LSPPTIPRIRRHLLLLQFFSSALPVANGGNTVDLTAPRLGDLEDLENLTPCGAPVDDMFVALKKHPLTSSS